MNWLLLLWLLLPLQGQTRQAPRLETPESSIGIPAGLGEKRDVTVLSFEGKEFIDAFNASSSMPRLLLIFSPG